MDKMIYMAAQAAKAAVQRQENVATNLANLSTTGFKSQLVSFRSSPLQADHGFATRAFAMETLSAYDFTPGPLNQTERNLDLAVQGPGFFAIQTPGGEQYTRAGNFQINADSVLVNSAGLPVLDNNGAEIQIPANSLVDIDSEGRIFARIGNQAPEEVAQIKLINPELTTAQKSEAGYFVFGQGQVQEADPDVRVASGYLEGGNAKSPELMVQMIEAQRYFEAQMKIISSAEQNAQAANDLYGMS